MSLLSAASVWTTDTSIKKRTPVLRRPAQISPEPESAPEGTDRAERVNQLLAQMEPRGTDSDLADFAPMRHDTAPPKLEYRGPQITPPAYASIAPAADKLSNYSQSYEPRAALQYAPRQMSTGVDSRLLEKINYMIHMMEEQQYERTSNVTEEFVLYMFLGVFVIFVVDSFSRIGKYSR